MQEIRVCLNSLAGLPAVVESMLRAVPEERLTRRRAPDTWTILEHVLHLNQVQPMLHGRIKQFLQPGVPTMVPFDPFAEQPMPGADGTRLDEVLADFADIRRAILDTLSAMPAEAWDREALHPEYDRYSLRILVRHMLMHDYWHLYRIEELWLLKDEFFA